MTLDRRAVRRIVVITLAVGAGVAPAAWARPIDLGPAGPVPSPSWQAVVVSTGAEPGLGWGSAAVGAGGAFVVSFAGVSVTLAAIRRRGRRVGERGSVVGS